MTPKAAIDHTPALDKEEFDCPTCGTYAHHTWSAVYYETEDDGFVPATERFEHEMNGNVWGVERIAVGTWRWAESTCHHVSVWRDDLLIFPRSSALPEASSDMPPHVLKLYDEAREVMPVSRRAGTALARATLELLVKTLYPEQTGSLADRLGEIIPKVSSSLGQMLTVIRHVGNKTLHVDELPDDAVLLVLDPADEALVSLMFESINELVDEVVTKPAIAKKYLDLVPENVKKNVKGLGTPS